MMETMYGLKAWLNLVRVVRISQAAKRSRVTPGNAHLEIDAINCQ